jgi:ATP-dependent DNA ligase
MARAWWKVKAVSPISSCCISRQHDARCYLIGFDLLQLEQRDLKPLTLELRKDLLARLLEGSTKELSTASIWAGMATRFLAQFAKRAWKASSRSGGTALMSPALAGTG